MCLEYFYINKALGYELQGWAAVFHYMIDGSPGMLSLSFLGCTCGVSDDVL